MTISWKLSSRISPILITLFVALQISACSTEDFANAVADNIVSESSGAVNTGTAETSDTSNTTNTTNNNHAAVISGNDSGSVTEDLDGNNDGLLDAGGKLNIMDDDAGEAAFIATTVNSNYGSLNIDASGNWFYSANNSLAVIQDLTSSETLIDSLTVSSIDGTTHAVVITINGVDESSTGGSAPTEPAPTIPEPTGVIADVNLSWVAPAEREDNTAISLSEIAGYKIYYGTSQGNYTDSVNVNDGSTVSHTFNSFLEGTYYFVITTYDTEGRESQFSSVVTITI